MTSERADLQPYLDLCKTHEVEELRRTLSQALFRLGLKNFLVDVIAPLKYLVGDCWARGIFAVYEEHLYTEVVQNLLRNAISAIVQRPGHSTAHPCIQLTTFPQEQHGLGLLENHWRTSAVSVCQRSREAVLTALVYGQKPKWKHFLVDVRFRMGSAQHCRQLPSDGRR